MGGQEHDEFKMTGFVQMNQAVGILGLEPGRTSWAGDYKNRYCVVPCLSSCNSRAICDTVALSPSPRPLGMGPQIMALILLPRCFLSTLKFDHHS